MSRISRVISSCQKRGVKIRSSSRVPNQHQERSYLTNNETRNAAIQSLFRHLENNYGNLPSLIDQGPAAETIVSTDGVLRPDHLARLFRHEATALHVINFFNRQSAVQLGEELIKEAQRGGGSRNWKVSTSRGLESSDVVTLGEHSPYNVAVARNNQLMAQNRTKSNDSGGVIEDEEAPAKSPIDEYFEGVQREFRLRRLSSRHGTDDKDNVNEILYYQLWPLDKLRLELDEAWPSGAGLAREPKSQQQNQQFARPFGGGLPRIMVGPTRWKRGFIHVDEMGPLNENRGLFSANIYLTMPQCRSNVDGKNDAGALYIWPLGVRSRWDWYKNAMTLSSLSAQDPEAQLNLHAQLGPPNIVRPTPGDLVLLCAQRPHCAVGFDEGVRVSLQCFLQYDGLDNRLTIDC